MSFPDSDFLDDAKDIFKKGKDGIKSAKEVRSDLKAMRDANDDPEGKGATLARLRNVFPEMDEETRADFLDRISISYGGGPFNQQLATFFYSLDKYDHHTLPPNALRSGFTFMTRPRLCFSDSALSKIVEFLPLLSDKPATQQFAIRALLDTEYANITRPDLVRKSPLLDPKNPFLTPVCNAITGVSGFPDPIVDTLTTDAGFYSEDQTFAVGHDMLNKSYDLSVNIGDTQFSPVASTMYFWILYIAYVTKGLMPAYAKDIEQQRLNYTVSIYRFITDPTKRFITHYAKATGCFPKSMPLGEIFDFSDSSRFITSAGEFTVPFACNKVEYNNPNILSDFNTLVERYHDAHSPIPIKDKDPISNEASDNYNGIPYIMNRENTGEKLELVFK